MDAVTTPAPKGPVEKKVKASAYATYGGVVLLMLIMQGVSNDPGMIAFLPDWLETLIIPLVPAGLTWAAGYRAKHTPRPDLEGPPEPVRKYPIL